MDLRNDVASARLPVQKLHRRAEHAAFWTGVCDGVDAISATSADHKGTEEVLALYARRHDALYEHPIIALFGTAPGFRLGSHRSPAPSIRTRLLEAAQ